MGGLTSPTVLSSLTTRAHTIFTGVRRSTYGRLFFILGPRVLCALVSTTPYCTYVGLLVYEHTRRAYFLDALHGQTLVYFDGTLRSSFFLVILTSSPFLSACEHFARVHASLVLGSSNVICVHNGGFPLTGRDITLPI
eukprot:6181101-Pleurochrysis_carterae.AAC.3